LAAVTAQRDLGVEFFRLLAITRARKIRERRSATSEEIAALREFYTRGWVASSYPGTVAWDELEAELRAMPDPLATTALPSDEYEALLRALAALDEHTRAIESAQRAPVGVEQPRVGKPRHRRPDAIPEATVKALKLELTRRRACRGDRRLIRGRKLTQEQIAERLELQRTRVQQAEALDRAGWDLLRSDPEFSANDGFVRWPSAAKATVLLASERAEN
jgi:hypothetical protein